LLKERLRKGAALSIIEEGSLSKKRRVEEERCEEKEDSDDDPPAVSILTQRKERKILPTHRDGMY